MLMLVRGFSFTVVSMYVRCPASRAAVRAALSFGSQAADLRSFLEVMSDASNRSPNPKKWPKAAPLLTSRLAVLLLLLVLLLQLLLLLGCYSSSYYYYYSQYYPSIEQFHSCH